MTSRSIRRPSGLITLGQPRAHYPLPRGSIDDACPLITGTNLLRDPGAELGTAMAMRRFDTTWVLGTAAFPAATGNLSPYTSVAYYTEVDSPCYDGNWFAVSTANPRTGTNHLRYAPQTSGFTCNVDVFFVGLNACAPIFGASFDYHLAAGRIDPGMTATFEAYLAQTTAAAPVWTMRIDYYDDTGFISQTQTTPTVTSTYQAATIVDTAPAGARYLTTHIALEDTDTTGDTFDIDDVSVIVT